VGDGTPPRSPFFDPAAFSLKLRVAMAEANLSYRELEDLAGVDQASIFRVAKHGKTPNVENYLRLRHWMTARDGDPHAN